MRVWLEEKKQAIAQEKERRKKRQLENASSKVSFLVARAPVASVIPLVI